MCLDLVIEQLDKMTEQEKDRWILMQAIIAGKGHQEGFVASLKGEKKIQCMPPQEEIDEFCEKVASGEVYVEYETHYYEFLDGRYYGDWKAWYNDPLCIFFFLRRVFNGCNDLILIEEYQEALVILEKICMLELAVVDAEDSEDTAEEATYAVAQAIRDGQVSMGDSQIATDWLRASAHVNKDCSSTILADALICILEHPLCEFCNSGLLSEALSKDILVRIIPILERDFQKYQKEYQEKYLGDTFVSGEYIFKKKLEKKEKILLDVREKCMEQSNDIEEQESVLRTTWEQIQELLTWLGYERYIDDQVEISEIWEICEALVKHEELQHEKWELRKSILCEMVEKDYYDYFGCDEPMHDLAQKLYVTEEELLEYADILNTKEYYKREAATIYREHGKEEKYVQYLETHLHKENRNYIELMNYYEQNENSQKAREVAELALSKCKEELTEIIIYLLKDAKKNNDEERYKKFYKSAKLRRSVNITKVDEAISKLQDGIV